MTHRVITARVEDALLDFDDASIDLIHADPPYFRVLAELWDRQWKTRADYLSWLSGVLDGFRRVLKPNGSLYVWASSEMAAYVEVEVVAPRFEVLSSIAWAKAHADLPPGDPRLTAFKARDLESQRTYFDETERVIFAEHRGADTFQGVPAYIAADKALKKKLFGDYLGEEMANASVSRGEVAALFPSASGGLTGCVTNWLQGYNIPTAEQWEAIRARLNDNGDLHLRREYGHLCREYEELRRPFFANRDGFTNVWTYAPAEIVKGRHPAEKPLDMMLDIVRASTREGARVLDAFAGSGTMTTACVDLGRDVVAIEMDAELCADIERRADRHEATKTGRLHRMEIAPIRGPLVKLWE